MTAPLSRVRSHPYFFVVILNAVKDLLLLFPFRCFPSSSARPNHPAVAVLGALLSFVVIPTERSDEGSLFVPRNRQNRPAYAAVSPLSSLFVVILNAVKDLLLLFPSRCFVPPTPLRATT